MDFLLYLRFVVFAGLIWLFSTVLYNLRFHSLSGYPGPWYTRGSRLWYIFKVFQGCHKIAIKELHDQYGLVVRIAPNELSYIDPKAWNDIYGKDNTL
ncbi:cytochrome P450 [Penicillium taxi]|uniref:cytochrome P450 n=1 Tax=Penicillium taxi TaxID=168475 RepID=UPI002545BB8E|nr:cytochrome P450 [Penicillium taxi]KAJ5908819.1 cytochrome P450 [Penicillium taxi]